MNMPVAGDRIAVNYTNGDIDSAWCGEVLSVEVLREVTQSLYVLPDCRDPVNDTGLFFENTSYGWRIMSGITYVDANIINLTRFSEMLDEIL